MTILEDSKQILDVKAIPLPDGHSKACINKSSHKFGKNRDAARYLFKSISGEYFVMCGRCAGLVTKEFWNFISG